MLHDALSLADEGPVLIRYPKGKARQVTEHEVGRGLAARPLHGGDGSVCILAVGKMVEAAERAVEQLAVEHIDATLWDVRCAAPLDPLMIRDAARHSMVVTVEDGITMIADSIHHIDRPDPLPHVEVLGVPTRFIPQGKPDKILAHLGLDANGIASTVRGLVG